MKLLRVHAFAVEPSRFADEAVVTGGELKAERALGRVLEEAAKPIDEDGVPIAFTVNSATRTHPVRELCRDIALESPAKALQASKSLAEQLARAMDERSEPALFIVAVYSAGDERRRLHMWTFPREEAFKFKTGATPEIELLSDIFSRRSRMRKGARFEGRSDRTSFLSGKAFDYQAHYAAKPIADFWIVRFLNAQLEITPSAGTRMLADCLRQAFDRSERPPEKDELYRAAIALRASRRRRWSLEAFGDEYLRSDDLRKRFLSLAPNEESRSALFEFDHAEFESRVDTRIFKLEDGVMVTAPFSAVGKSVRLLGREDNQTLHCEGKVVKEQLRRRPRRGG